jgi:hypothetical protein
MRILGKRYSPKELARLAMTFGLLVTDAEVWSAMDEQLRQRADGTGERIRSEFAPLPMQRTSEHVQLRKNNDWVARVASLLAGVGVGISVGMFLAPTSGDEMRAALRSRVSAVKTNLGDMANRATRFGDEVRSTGTAGD